MTHSETENTFTFHDQYPAISSVLGHTKYIKSNESLNVLSVAYNAA